LHLSVALPELTLATGAMVLLLVGVSTRKEQAELILWAAVLFLALAGVFVLRESGTTTLFGDSFIVDPFARALKLLTLTGSAVTLIMSIDYWRGEGRLKFEFPILVLLATTGMLMMISANDLIALYVGLELQSLALYVVAAFDRRSAKSSEAGIKYFVLGALSSGMLLYGASLIYGFTGSTLFTDIAAAVQPSGANLGLIFGLVFLMTGFAFKISAVPFHMWTPDVYEGAPTPVTAFFAAAPKLAAFALTVRTLLAAFPSVTHEWQQIVTFLAIASMALGSFAAIGQRNIKRLMAYSSIGHMGYALVGLAAGTAEGVQGVIVYLAIYLAMTLGTFACILAMRRHGRMVEDIDQLAGLSTTSPMMAFLLAMLLFSLAGIPPLAGFFAKFYVFLAAINAGLYALAVIGVLLSVVGAYYYLRIV
jgi:NADH-quinone oxidoreductase subunit N